MTLVLSYFLRLRLERILITSNVRATIQLLGVGYVLLAATQLAYDWWAIIWVGAMTIIGTVILRRRSPFRGPSAQMLVTGAAAVLMIGLVVVTAGVFFGLGVFDFDPITLLVLSGLTVGNGVSSGASALGQTTEAARTRAPELEALLASGGTRWQTISHLIASPARLSLIPQIERVKVVGLIALPGAMSGMLLAGADPIDAVLTQLLIMFMVSGTYALSTVVMTISVGLIFVTGDLRLASVPIETD